MELNSITLVLKASTVVFVVTSYPFHFLKHDLKKSFCRWISYFFTPWTPPYRMTPPQKRHETDVPRSCALFKGCDGHYSSVCYSSVLLNTLLSAILLCDRRPQRPSGSAKWGARKSVVVFGRTRMLLDARAYTGLVRSIPQMWYS